jgi:hypothetical protein
MQISLAILLQGVVKRKTIAFIKEPQVVPTHICGLGLYERWLSPKGEDPNPPTKAH